MRRRARGDGVPDGRGGAVAVSAGTSAGNSCVITNIATLAPMSAFSAVEMGPGPNEIDDVLADG